MRLSKKVFSSPLGLSLLSVILLSLPWWGLSAYFVLVGWVPMLVLHDKMRAKGKKGFLWWLTFTIMAWHLATCYWVSYATIMAIVAVPLVCWSMLWWPWVAYNRVSKLGSRVLSYTVLVSGWVVCEWWLASGDMSFGWLQMGAAWARDSYAVQWYSLFGVYGGTLWVMLSNVVIYEVIRTGRSRRGALCVVLIPIISSLIMYVARGESDEGRVAVAIVQPNIDAYKKYSEFSAEEQLQNILNIASDAPDSTQLYVAPETALIYTVDLRKIETNRDIATLQKFLAEKSPEAMFIIGASSYDGSQYYNSVLYITKDSVKIYHKRKLVFGVEAIPEWAVAIGEMIDLGGVSSSLGRSSEALVENRAGAVICFESIYGELMTEWVESGAELLAVITNDGWWGDTPGYRQHFSYSRLRAIECGRWVVRSANTGISGIITSRGDVIHTLGWDKRGLVTGSVAMDNSVTLYVKWGDIVFRLSTLVFALSLLYSVSLHYKRKNLLR